RRASGRGRAAAAPWSRRFALARLGEPSSPPTLQAHDRLAVHLLRLVDALLPGHDGARADPEPFGQRAGRDVAQTLPESAHAPGERPISGARRARWRGPDPGKPRRTSRCG